MKKWRMPQMICDVATCKIYFKFYQTSEKVHSFRHTTKSFNYSILKCLEHEILVLLYYSLPVYDANIILLQGNL